MGARVALVRFAAVCWMGAGALSAQSVSVWLTTDDQKSLMQPQPALPLATGASGGTSATLATVIVDEQNRMQSIDGFGAAMTDSSAYLLNEKVPKAALAGVMQSLFDPAKGIGVNFLRNPMGASDLARAPYTFDDLTAGATDAKLASFSIAHDQVDIIPMIQLAKSINPELRLMANPWSPPAWMKSTGSIFGEVNNVNSTLLPQFYDAFANYYVKYLQAYAAAGVPLDYISLQNEPLNPTTNYPGMFMASGDQLNVLRDHMLPALTAAKLTTRVLVYDHNWDTPSYAQTVLGDATVAASPLVAGTAWHWYGGPPGAMTIVHNQWPELDQFVTEASGGTWIADEVKQDFEMIVHSLRNWARSYVKWGLALDQNRGPNDGGCNTCTPLVTVNETTGAVSYPIDYYTLGHFSKFIRQGAVRLWTNNLPGLITVAFANPDASLALVVYNDSAVARQFQVVARGHRFTASLAALAGATYTWKVDEPGEMAMESKDRWEPHRNPGLPPGHSYLVPARNQIQASSYIQVSNLQSETCTDTDGGFDLGSAAVGSWAEYDNVDFGAGVTTVDARLATASSGGTLEFHLDRVDGPLAAQVTVPKTGGWQTWSTVGAPVTGAAGVHRVVLLYTLGPANDGSRI